MNTIYIIFLTLIYYVCSTLYLPNPFIFENIIKLKYFGKLLKGYILSIILHQLTFKLR